MNMPREGNINPSASIAEMVQTMYPSLLPAGVKFSAPFVVLEDLAADASVHGVQNPSDSDCLVAAILNVTTNDATETIDVGVDTDGTNSSDTLIDGGDVGAAVAVLSSIDHGGTNGKGFRLIDKKGGANDYVTFTASAGTDTLAGQVALVFIPLNE
jgi:hypothetical protein